MLLPSFLKFDIMVPLYNVLNKLGFNQPQNFDLVPTSMLVENNCHPNSIAE